MHISHMHVPLTMYIARIISLQWVLSATVVAYKKYSIEYKLCLTLSFIYSVYTNRKKTHFHALNENGVKNASHALLMLCYD